MTNPGELTPRVLIEIFAIPVLHQRERRKGAGLDGFPCLITVWIVDP